LQPITQGKICGKRSRGRPRTSWLEWFQYNTKELFSAIKGKKTYNHDYFQPSIKVEHEEEK
jgi:hypothetical protein